MPVVSKKRFNKSAISNAVAHIHSSYNNTIITIADTNGDVIAWSSSGRLKFKGARKSTPYAAAAVAEDCGKRASELGVCIVEVRIKGPGFGREPSIKKLSDYFVVSNIKDVTPIAFNGPRRKKARRN